MNTAVVSLNDPTETLAVSPLIIGIVACCLVIVVKSFAYLTRDDYLVEISEQIQSDLLRAAKSAAARAYCPYSRFRVGAAVLTDRGEIFAGCNVENASYGLTICAERNAIFQAVAHSPGVLVIRAVVVYTPTASPTAPCGACRQVINEFGPDALVISVCEGPAMIRSRTSDLLPSAFGPSNLSS